MLPNNHAFIDANNIHYSSKLNGWEIDYARFRLYLREKYQVQEAHMFIGYIEKYRDLYTHLQSSGFILHFKTVIVTQSGQIKGNVDGHMIVETMKTMKKYDKAVIVTGDGDFEPLVSYLIDEKKLAKVIAPSVRNCSSLLRRLPSEYLAYISDLEKKVGYTKKEPQGDETP